MKFSDAGDDMILGFSLLNPIKQRDDSPYIRTFSDFPLDTLGSWEISSEPHHPD